MAEVTGSFRDAVMSVASLGQPRVVFYLPDPQLSTGIAPGRMTPTEPVFATLNVDNEFTINLISTENMLDPDAHYRIRLEWTSAGEIKHVMDFPDWKIYVPENGGSLDDLARYGQGGWWNQRLIWVSLTAPRHPRRGMMWLLSDPNNPDNITSHPSWEPSWEIGDLLEWE